MNKKIIQLICPDQKGIISKLTSVLYKANHNILSIQQHIDKEKEKFYIRISVHVDSKNKFPEEKLFDLNKQLNGKMCLFNSDKKINVAILGTKETEPVYDLLIKNESSNLRCNFPILISNHRKLSSVAKQFNINFCKIDDNIQLSEALTKNKVDLIVLARYMQIIPDNIVKQYQNNIINIHHGFLPAFKGAKPYHQAYNKGVKIVGATAHYVTKDLEAGPIIEQTISHISHRDEVSDLIRKGRDLERVALARAIRLHLRRQVIVYRGRTAVFT